MKIPLWQFSALYLRPEMAEHVKQAIVSGDTGTLDDVINQIRRDSNEQLLRRELTHTIQNQFSGEEAPRELIQNSLDAGAKDIAIKYRRKGDEQTLQFTDDGVGLSFDDFFSYLLVVGNSKKLDDQASIGLHGQGFFSLLRQSSGVTARSGNWEIGIKDGENGHEVVFKRTRGTFKGTRISAEGFHAREELGDYLMRTAVYVDPARTKVRINGTQINHVTSDLTLERTIEYDDAPTPLKVMLSTKPRTTTFVHEGLYIGHGHHPSRKLNMVVNVPSSVRISRGRNEVPARIDNYIHSKHGSLVRAYTNHLLSQDDLTPQQVLWLEENYQLRYGKILLSTAGAMVAAPVALGALELSVAAIEYVIDNKFGEFLAKTLEYGFYGVVLTGIGTAGVGAGYAAKNWYKNRGTPLEERVVIDEDTSGFSLRSVIQGIASRVSSVIPRQRFKNKPTIDATIVDGFELTQRKVSINEVKKARKRHELFFSRPGDQDGMYISGAFEERYKYDRHEGSTFVDITMISGLALGAIVTIPLWLPFILVKDKIYAPVPSTAVKVANRLGLAKTTHAVEEVGNYLTGIVAEATGHHDVGILTGYATQQHVGAWTMRMFGQPSYVAINRRSDAYKAIAKDIRSGLSPEAVESYLHVICHEYAHHMKRSMLGNAGHSDHFFDSAHAIRNLVFSHIYEKQIDIVAEANKRAAHVFAK